MYVDSLISFPARFELLHKSDKKDYEYVCVPTTGGFVK